MRDEEDAGDGKKYENFGREPLGTVDASDEPRGEIAEVEDEKVERDEQISVESAFTRRLRLDVYNDSRKHAQGYNKYEAYAEEIRRQLPSDVPKRDRMLRGDAIIAPFFLKRSRCEEIDIGGLVVFRNHRPRRHRRFWRARDRPWRRRRGSCARRRRAFALILLSVRLLHSLESPRVVLRERQALVHENARCGYDHNYGSDEKVQKRAAADAARASCGKYGRCDDG